MKEVSIQRIRKRYPKPKSFSEGKIRPGAYCVGGAMMHFAGLPNGDGFPEVEEIAEFLLMANLQLTPEDADHFAVEIVRLNDGGNFSLAWEMAERALEHQA
ncbi:hypothetical protein HY229_03480 [Candidatus Acetothermia bacterium]|nr:hypothetical protein [Candidatus Acetothermia bacterium]MBI3643145.1 hypothetical protein [Candidatus Acetothermia bacterium]